MYKTRKSLLILPSSNLFSAGEVAAYRKSKSPCRAEKVHVSARTACSRRMIGRPSSPLPEGQTHTKLSTKQLGKLQAALVPDLCSLHFWLSTCIHILIRKPRLSILFFRKPRLSIHFSFVVALGIYYLPHWLGNGKFSLAPCSKVKILETYVCLFWLFSSKTAVVRGDLIFSLISRSWHGTDTPATFLSVLPRWREAHNTDKETCAMQWTHKMNIFFTYVFLHSAPLASRDVTTVTSNLYNNPYSVSSRKFSFVLVLEMNSSQVKPLACKQ